MSNKSSNKIDNIGSVLTASTCAIALPVVFFILPVLNYKLPVNNTEDLRFQRENVLRAEYDYINIRDEVFNKSKDTLLNNSTYMGLMEQIYIMQGYGYNLKNSAKYVELTEKADSIEENLRNEYINKSAELSEASAMLSASYDRLYKLQRDSTIRDSMLNIPVNKRFRNNLLQIRIDRNQNIKDKSEKKLILLRQKLQNSK